MLRPPSRSPLVRLLASASLLSALVLAGCAEKSPEERIAETRSRYEATLNGFVVRQEPEAAFGLGGDLGPEGPESDTGGEGGTEATGGEPGARGEEAGGEAMIEEEDLLPVTQDVVLDILIRHYSTLKLPGITVDISQVDGQKQEKGNWRVWIDTSHIERGPGAQITHVLEDLDYQAGDGFSVEIRHPVPPGERSEYREFQTAL